MSNSKNENKHTQNIFAVVAYNKTHLNIETATFQNEMKNEHNKICTEKLLSTNYCTQCVCVCLSVGIVAAKRFIVILTSEFLIFSAPVPNIKMIRAQTSL